MSRTIKNFLYNSSYQIFAIIVPLVTTPYLSRVLGAYGVGQYAYVYSIAFYFGIFIKLGIQNYGNRTIAKCRDDFEERSDVFFNLYIMQFILMIIFVFFYLIYTLFFSYNKIYTIIMIFYVISAGLDISWFYFGLEKFKFTASRDYLIKVTTVVCIILFVRKPDDIWKYILIQSIGFLLSQIILWLNIKNYISFYKPSWNKVKSHIKPNLILFIPTIAISIYKIMDKIMLGIMADATEVGYYHSCENIVRIPLALITSLGTVMLPKMSNIYGNEKGKEAEIIFEKSINFAILLVSIISFGMMTVSREFVPIFYGDGFDKCIYLYYIILPSCLFIAFANVIRTQFLIPNSWDKVYVISLVLGAIVNLICNIILIPYLKSYGAAVGTLIAEMIVCVSQCYAVRNELPIKHYVAECSKYIIAGTAGFLLFFNNSFCLTGCSLVNLLLKIFVVGIVIIMILLILWRMELQYKKKKNYSR